jgi:glyoxylase-like metal-dependent hydrolase (beta-lactamase superfamily II)
VSGTVIGWRIGEISITPVLEVDAGPVIDGILPDTAAAARRSVKWLRPRFVDADGRSRAVVQAFAIQTGATRILVDPGVGDRKPRPEIPAWSGMHTGFLDRLSAAGFAPAAVDCVLVTHLHLDHVGWLTRMAEDHSWVSTFPGARHLLVDRELDYWLGRPAGPSRDAHAAIDDSVRPVLAAGLVERVAPSNGVAAGVSLLPSHGHTPGHVSVLIESGGQSAVITGDAIHHPVQLVHPELGSASDFGPAAAHRSRVELLERCVSTGALLIGSHFAEPSAGRVVRDGAGYRLDA